jgi:hypothetical protein
VRRTHMRLRGVEETQVPRGHGRCHKTPYGVEAALNQVWYSPAISRLIFARMHPLQTRLCASSSEMSSPRCPCSPVSHNNHSL